MKNKNGFTLAEVLVVVVLLAVIALITVPSVMKILNSNKDKQYEEYEKVLKDNLKIYAIDHSEELFVNGNSSVGVSYDELLQANPDINVGDCTNIKLKIENNSGKYNYNVCMACEKDEQTGEYKRIIGENCDSDVVIDTVAPNITMLEVQSGYYKLNGKIAITATLNEEVTGELPKLNVKVGSTIKTLTGIKDNKQISYDYTVNSGENGSLEIISIVGGSLVDKVGNKFNNVLPTISGGPVIIDTIKPTCSITNNNSLLTITQEDNNINPNGYAWSIDSYSNINTKQANESKTYYAWVKDLSGNVNSCSLNVDLLPALFGNGSDGVGLFTTDTVWYAPIEDTSMIVKEFETLTISEGVTVSAGNRNAGMIIRVKGDCIINGTLANNLSSKTLLESDNVDFSSYPKEMLTTLAGNGGSGGSSMGPSPSGIGYFGGSGGSGMAGRFYGGGYSGGGAGQTDRYDWNAGGNGGSAANITTAVSNIFIGGSGHGGAGQYGGGGGDGCSDYTGGSGPGGKGMGGYSWLSGGGAGNIGGGVVILYVGGNLTINGTINCAGGNGGASGTGSMGLAGGGAGGGRIYLVHNGTITNNGTLNVAGGTGANNGGAGTTNIVTYAEYKINN